MQPGGYHDHKKLVDTLNRPVPIEVIWEQLAVEGQVDYYKEAWTEIFFKPVIEGLRQIGRDEMGKEAINKSFELGLADGMTYEEKLFYILFASEDQKEGMRAFVEKRKPVWQGK